MKQFGQSKPMAYTACACFACAGMLALTLDVSLSALLLLGVVVGIILLGAVRLLPCGEAIAR